MNQKYELVVILKALLPEDVRTLAQDKIENMVKNMKGKIIKTDVWGKRHLAYKIKKHDEGFYIVYNIELSKSEINSFKSNLTLMPEVLRFLVLRQEEV